MVKVNEYVKFSRKTVYEGKKTELVVSIGLDHLHLNNTVTISDKTVKRKGTLFIFSIEMSIKNVKGHKQGRKRKNSE